MEKRERIARYEQASELLPHRLRKLALALPDRQKEYAEELRLRTAHPMTVLTPEGEISVAPSNRDAIVVPEDLEQMLSAVTDYSRYASMESIRQGYLCVRGGFRLGICGTLVMRDGMPYNIREFSGFALRIVREQIGIATGCVPKLFSPGGQFQSTLILSAPGGGKTTLLRDLIRCLSLGDSEHRAQRVAVIDERGEIAVSCQGRAQMELGNHTDVLCDWPKAIGIPMVLRAMNPQIIALDEITVSEDIRAMCMAANCGVGLLATIHAGSEAELLRKPLWRELLTAGVFQRILLIRNDCGVRSYEVKELECCGCLAEC